MDTKLNLLTISLWLFTFLFSYCNKKNDTCSKMGYEYTNTTSRCWYIPEVDSIQVGSFITLKGVVPKKFIDENTNISVLNSATIINGPLGITMLYPNKQGSVENFELISEIGSVIKNTTHFSETALKNFRTLNWDGSLPDSFKIQIKIKPLVKGIYIVSLGQQGYRDKDCALYKYFLKVGNADQHLNYLAQYNNGYISDYERNYAYCFKVY